MMHGLEDWLLWSKTFAWSQESLQKEGNSSFAGQSGHRSAVPKAKGETGGKLMSGWGQKFHKGYFSLGP